MAFALTTVTGSAVTGLTTPTYTFTQGVAPSSNGKQFSVTSLGGTQTGVRTHSPSSPFSFTFFTDPNPKQIGPVDANGVLRFVPNNKYRLIGRVGVLPLAGQPYRVATIRVEVDLPAGAELADTAQVKAMWSAVGGVFNQHANDHFNTVSTGIL
jgi:hypothetical protein